MSGNALYLVCQPCEQANQDDFGVKLAQRSTIGWYEHEVPPKQFDAWLAKHKRCGGRGNPDHFILAHVQPRNHDQLEPDPVAQGINGALQ